MDSYIFDFINKNISNFLIIFTRLSGLFLITPIFGRRNIPVYTKLGFAFFMSFIALPMLSDFKMEDNLILYALILIKEFLIGLTIGFITFVSFSSIYLAGQFLDLQMGFGIVNILDFQNNFQVPLLANFLYIMAILIYFITNGHYYILKAIIDSFKYIPVGYFVVNDNLMHSISQSFINMFVIGFKISIPVLLVTLLSDVVMGILSRFIPQLNVFMMGIPFKIVIGIIVLFLTLPVYLIILDVIFNGMHREMFIFIKAIYKGGL